MCSSVVAYDRAERINLLLNSFDYIPQRTRHIEKGSWKGNIEV